VAALVETDIVRTEPLHVTVELSGGHTTGMTLCDGRSLGPDLRPRGGQPRSDAAVPNADVAVAVDVDRFWELFLDVLATYP
jgi:inosine-uridine nucleoside N-ribohydrolase